MQKSDTQLGKPGILYKDTKANIEAIAAPVEGMVAYATDTDEFGIYDGAAWTWGKWGGSGDANSFNGRSLSAAPPNVGEAYVWDGEYWIPLDHGGLAGLGDNDHPQYIGNQFPARLSFESGSPVSTTDQSSKTNLYLTPKYGGLVQVYNGSNWNPYTLPEISISLAGLTASKIYDVFVYPNGTTPTLEMLAWTNLTTRATALTRLNGRLVKSGAATRLYVGSVYINSSGGQSDDTIVKGYIYNYYNRVVRRHHSEEHTSHVYNGAYRKWNNSDTGNLIEFLIGYQEEPTKFIFNGEVKAGADGSYAGCKLYLDGSALSGDLLYINITNFNNQYLKTGVSYQQYVGIGYHYVQMYETGNHAASTFNNMWFEVEVPT